MADPQPGGTPGQVLTKTGFNDYETAWSDPTGGGGGGGTPATAVTNETTFGTPPSVGSSLNYARQDHTHGTQARELPAGGTTGQSLTKVDGTDYNTQWATITGGGGAAVLVPTAIKTADYNAAAGEFVLFDTTSGARTLTLPNAPAAGTQVGARIVTFGTGNFVTVSCSGADTFTKAGAPASTANVLQVNGTAVLYVYQGGFWQIVSFGYSLPVLDGRYVQSANAVSIAAGNDITVNAPVGGISTVQVAQASHDIWTKTLVGPMATDGPTCNNDATNYQNDTAFTFTPAASARYWVHWLLLMNGTTTEDCRLAFVGPTGATFDNWGGFMPHNSVTTGSMTIQRVNIVSIANAVQLGMLTGSNMAVEVWGWLVTSTTSGPVYPQYRQWTAGAFDLKRMAGSWMTYQRYS